MILGQMDRHIGRTVVLAQIVVLLCFGTLVTLFSLVEEFQDVGRGNYSPYHAVVYVALTTPRQIFELMPYIVFIGTLVGLGILASASEITVLRAAGVPLARLFTAAAIPAIVVLSINMVMGQTTAVVGEAQAVALKTEARSGSDDNPIFTVNWYREGGLYTSIQGFDNNGDLIGVRQFETDEDGRMIVSRRAERGVRRDDHWLLFNVLETKLRPSETQAAHHDEWHWQSTVDPDLLSAKLLVDPHRLSTTDLMQQIAYLTREELDPSRYQVALWTVLFQPLSILGLVLLAVGFVVGPLREVSMGVRLTVGVLVGLTFKYLQDILGPMSIVFGLPPPIAVLIPIALCWLAGMVLLRRAS